MGRTQGGNNNGYCQDNEITWVHWAEADNDLLDFTCAVSAIRAQHPVFRRRGFFEGMPVRRRGAEGLPDITWFTPDGAEMSEVDWDTGFGKAIAVYLNGNGIGDRDPRGQRVTDDSFIMLFNAHHEPIEFNLPPAEFASTWTPVVSTTTANGNGEESSEDVLKSSSPVVVDGRSLMLLKAGADELV